MYIDELLLVFEKAVSDFPELNNQEAMDLLRAGIVAKKYDLQDEGLIEALLREDKKELVESLEQGLHQMVLKLEGEQRTTYLETDEAKKEAINIFIASLEHLINYYYNNVIGKHFSST